MYHDNMTNIINIANKLASEEKISLTPEKEGEYGVNDGELIALLQKLLHSKYALDVMYRSFADRTKGLWRDALVDHWHDHAKEEREATYDVAMKIMGLGADAIVSNITLPQCPPNIEAFCMILGKLELETINIAREVINASGDNVSIKVFAENIILVDTQHLDDLRRMLDMRVG